ncbi:MAG: hypothetical protein JXR80_11640 [Deltaproteobacteria bacterium]|nr:hypothetical protein [Deltaproteobacteria bacterium]
MFRKSKLFWLLFLATFSLFSLGGVSSQATVIQERTIIYYFHGNMRCQTCNKIEMYTKEIVNAGFSRELAEGSMEIRIVNTDKSENEHFIKDFKLTNHSLVLVQTNDDKVIKWKNLDRIWLLVRNKEAFQNYVSEEIRVFMAAEK